MPHGADNALEGDRLHTDNVGSGDCNRNRGDTGGLVSHHVGHVTPPAAATPEADPLISMIERAARDPSVDIDKMERLFQMHERMLRNSARVAYDEAFSTMQPELPEIDKRGKIIIKEKGGDKIIQSTPYALWDDTNRLIKPILAKYGFGLSFRIAQTEAKITTTAVLSHRGGHREDTSFSASIDATGSKNNVQGWGSSFSYGKRYTGTAILNITTKGEDDDGKSAGTLEHAVIDEDQEIALRDELEAAGKSVQAFCAFFKLAKLGDLPVTRVEEAKAAIRRKK